MSASTSFLPNMKLCICGESGVGKSSIVSKWVNDTVNLAQLPTIGADFAIKTMALEDERQVRLEVWDTAGKAQFRSLLPMYWRSCHAVVLVFDVTDRASFDLLDYFYAFLLSQQQHENCEPALLVLGNKAEAPSEQRQVSAAEAQMWCAGRKQMRGSTIYFEVSAHTGEGIEDAFQTLVEKLHAPQQAFIVTCTAVDDKVRCTTLAGEVLQEFQLPKGERPFGPWLFVALRDARPDRADALKLVTAEGELLSEAAPERGLLAATKRFFACFTS